jgi:CheY-like chemotaxis protein
MTVAAGMKTVLYIDDRVDDLFLFQRSCELAQVSFALKLAEGSVAGIRYLDADGRSAEGASQPRPDFILLDIKMPGMNGFEVLNWIRTHPDISKTPVAMYSSSTFDTDVLRGYLGGITFYIPKPQRLEGLTELARGLDECLASDGKDCKRLMRMSIARSEI